MRWIELGNVIDKHLDDWNVVQRHLERSQQADKEATIGYRDFLVDGLQDKE